MADYIYLLQNRLTPAQRQALESVRDAARTHGTTVFLVGGAVRDLTSGTPVRDLDFAVQGEAMPLVGSLQAGGATLAGENPVLSSAYLIFPGGARAELGPTLSVTYPRPGQPETQPAAILDDLRRRDFTANAMAISLNEGSYGLLLDPLNGVADIENREIRLVSNYGFIEQPALLLRAARLSERLGWTLEERTATRFATAKEENYMAALPARDRGYELEEIFHEEDPLGALEHLNGEGWRDALFPAWTTAQADREGLERVHDLMGQMEQMGIHIDPSPVFFPLLTAKLPPADLAALKGMFVRPGFVEQIDSLDARGRTLANQLTAKSAAAPSETWRILFAAEPEVVLWLAYSSRSAPVQSKFRAFLNEWPQMRQRIPYSLLQEMRITPDMPGYEKLLDDLFFALIDGNLSTPEAARAFLEPYSPPAPAPTVAPRRRPAKAARSRSRKAAAAPAIQADEPAVSSTGEAGEGDGAAPAEAAPRAKPSKAAAKPAGAKLAAKTAEPKEALTPSEPPPAAVPSAGSKAAAKSAPPVAEPKPAAKTATPAKSTPAKGASPVAPTSSAKPGKPAPAKQAPSGPPAAAKASPAAPVSKAVAAKGIPAKASTAAPKPVKAAGKTVARAAAPVKAPSSAAKVPATKVTAAKLPAKKTAVAKKATPPARPAKSAAPGKKSVKTVPAKAAKPNKGAVGKGVAGKGAGTKAVARKTVAAKARGRH